MPVPMITPTPKTTKSIGPSVRLRDCSDSSVSAMDCSTDLVRSSALIEPLLPAMLSAKRVGSRPPSFAGVRRSAGAESAVAPTRATAPWDRNADSAREL